MKLHKIIRKRFDRSREGVDVSADVNAVIAANIGERGATTHVSSRSRSTAGTPPDQPDPRGATDRERR